MTTLTLRPATPSSVPADALVVGIAQGPRGVVIVADAETAKAVRWLKAALSAVGATGAREEVVRLPAPAGSASPLVVATGLGAAGRTYDAEVVRRAVGAATRSLTGLRTAVIALPVATAEQAGPVAEGALIGAYEFRSFRHASTSDHPPALRTVILAGPATADRGVRAITTRARTIAEAVTRARDLVNTPASHLRPKELAAAAVELGEAAGLDVDVLDERALKRGGYGGILGVGQGSANPPRLVRIAYRPKRPRAHVALVGKGITFDSGGLSIKPPLGMEWMKSDMGGAAAVIAATVAIARLGLPVSVTAYAPLAENLPSGSATRPSDVLTMYGGRTVEVLNTDAEGRLVLADAIVRAGEDEPDLIVDIATLTGAQITALGTRVAGVMGNDDAARTLVQEAAARAGEQSWPMPLPDELRRGLDSSIADLTNHDPSRMGGMLVGGLFLRDFVGEGRRWVHLDIAGPAWNGTEAYGYTPRGGTGYGVRTLVSLVEAIAAGGLAYR
jgi:leucyl aminopeptidase